MFLELGSAFAGAPVYRIPLRETKRSLQLLRQGRMALDVGYETPAMFYSFPINRVVELPNVSTQASQIIERVSKNEFYYISEKIDETTDQVTQTLLGYSLATHVPRAISSIELYQGNKYGQPPYLMLLSPDESKIYLWSSSADKLEVIDLDKSEKSTVLKVPALENADLSDFRFVHFEGKDAIALVTGAFYQQSVIAIVDVEAKTLLLSRAGADFGRRDARPETEPFNINAVIDSRGDKAVFCDHDACVLAELASKKILKEFPLAGGNNSRPAFAEDGNLLFVCDSISNKFAVWNSEDGTPISSTTAEICAIEEQTRVENGFIVRNHDQILAVSSEGRIAAKVSVNGLNAFDDMTVVGDTEGVVTVISVDWQGRVQRHQLGFR